MDNIDLEILKIKCDEIVEYFSLIDSDIINNKFPRVVFNSLIFGSYYFDLDKIDYDNSILIVSSNLEDIEEYSIQEQKYIKSLNEKINSMFNNYKEIRAELEQKNLNGRVKTKGHLNKERL